jgi:hypothetical protein
MSVRKHWQDAHLSALGKRVMMVRICPKCGSLDVHRSRRRTVGEKLLSLVGVRPYRCFQCDARFTGWIFAKSMAPDASKRRTRTQSTKSEAPN